MSLDQVGTKKELLGGTDCLAADGHVATFAWILPSAAYGTRADSLRASRWACPLLRFRPPAQVFCPLVWRRDARRWPQARWQPTKTKTQRAEAVSLFIGDLETPDRIYLACATVHHKL